MSSEAGLIRILAVDDHPIVREGIAGLIAIQSDMVLAGEACDGREAIQQFRTLRPDVTLMAVSYTHLSGIIQFAATVS